MSKEKVVTIVVKNGRTESILISDSVTDGIKHAEYAKKNYINDKDLNQIIVIKQDENHNEIMFEYIPEEKGRSMLAKRLKELRISKNMSQAILGEKFGVTQSAIGMWETGIRNPDIEMLNKISKYFNVSIDSLISEKYNENLEKTKGNLKEKLNLLDAKINAEDKVIYQVMDLINIKYNGIEKMAIDEETLKLIDQLVIDWMWMYKKGFSMQQDPLLLMSQEDREYYSEMSERFGKFQDFMRYNMFLCD